MKPILFNTEMVRAILEGRKKTTRRIVKAKGYHITGIPSWAMFRRNPDDFFFDVCTTGKEPSAKTATTILIEPPARQDDILWVRETWTEMPYGFAYRADGEEPDGWDSNDRWYPSIHMPKEAARLFLQVTDVRVERLRDGLGCLQALHAEGVKSTTFPSILFEFRELWDSTIKPADYPRYGWAANPWVWVIEFERCEKP